jgi:hypothetical protein
MVKSESVKHTQEHGLRQAKQKNNIKANIRFTLKIPFSPCHEGSCLAAQKREEVLELTKVQE